MKRVCMILLVIAITVGIMVDTFYTMENYWTETCTDVHCTVCHK